MVQRSCSLTPYDGPQRLEGSPSPHAQWWPQPRQLHTYHWPEGCRVGAGGEHEGPGSETAQAPQPAQATASPLLGGPKGRAKRQELRFRFLNSVGGQRLGTLGASCPGLYCPGLAVCWPWGHSLGARLTECQLLPFTVFWKELCSTVRKW